MKILDLAKQREQEAEKLYTDLSKKTANPGLKTILMRLAEMEAKHYTILVRLQARGSDLEMPDNAAIGAIKTAFKQVTEAAAKFKAEMAQLDLYKLAQQREKEATAFYQGQADEAKDAKARQLFERLARQEKTHDQILESVIQFVSRPGEGHWLENAEWFHQESF
jgi:rubrerythrin